MQLFQLLDRYEFSRLNLGDPFRGRLLPRRRAPPQLMEVDLNLALFFGGKSGQALLDLENAHGGQNEDRIGWVKLLKPACVCGRRLFAETEMSLRWFGGVGADG